MSDIKLKAEKREVFGRKVARLRSQGVVPGNVYGSKTKSFAVGLQSKEFSKAYESAGETGIINLAIGAKSVPVLIQNLQTHPVSGEAIHVDFRQVNLKEKIMAMVPIELVGESPAVKNGKGILTQLMDEVEVEALPMDFPENIQADISTLTEPDQSITIAKLNYDKSKLSLQAEDEQLVARIAELRAEEEAPVVEAPEEELAEGEGKDEDGQEEKDGEGEAPENAEAEKKEEK